MAIITYIGDPADRQCPPRVECAGIKFTEGLPVEVADEAIVKMLEGNRFFRIGDAPPPASTQAPPPAAKPVPTPSVFQPPPQGMPKEPVARESGPPKANGLPGVAHPVHPSAKK